MTVFEQQQIGRRNKAKPGPVAEVIKIIAVKLSHDQAWTSDEDIAKWMALALEKWESGFAKELRDDLGDVAAAEKIIDELRNKPEFGWSRILRAGTN
jgi:hypothetical protein